MNNEKLMRDEWNEIARNNAFYGVKSDDEFENANKVNEENFWATGSKNVDLFLSKLDIKNTQNKNMVEIGCGLGRMTHRFAELFKYVYAVDISPEMIKKARKYWGHLKNVKFILGNGKDLHQITGSSTDFVFSFIVLQHVVDPLIVLNYIKDSSRILKKGGIAYLQFRTVQTPADLGKRRKMSLFSKIFPMLQKHSQKEKADMRLGDYFYNTYESWRGCCVDHDSVLRLRDEVGLKVLNVEGLNTQYTFYTFEKV